MILHGIPLFDWILDSLRWMTEDDVQAAVQYFSGRDAEATTAAEVKRQVFTSPREVIIPIPGRDQGNGFYRRRTDQVFAMKLKAPILLYHDDAGLTIRVKGQIGEWLLCRKDGLMEVVGDDEFQRAYQAAHTLGFS